MSQSSILIAALLGLFVLFLAAKGRLSTYVGVLLGKTDNASSSDSSSGSSAAKTAATVAQVAAVLA